MRVLSSILLVLFVTGASNASAQTGGSSIDSTADYRLQIYPWHIRLVSERSDLTAICRTPAHIYACTDFIGARLECHCERADTKWRLIARAQFIPFLSLWDIRTLFHEGLHIGDVRIGVVEHLRDLTSRRFETSDDCEESARRSSDGFVKEMNAIMVRSNEHRN